MRRRRRHIVPKSLILFLVVVFLGMGLGYAYLTNNIQINGNVGVHNSKWSIMLGFLSINSGSVEADEPTVTDTTVSFGATLSSPGDFYEFTFNILNDGNLAAKLDSFTVTPELTEEQSQFFSYTVTYADGTPIAIGDGLDPNHLEKIRVRFEYLEQNDTTLYPTTDQSFDCNISLYYVQGHGSVITRDVFVDNNSSFTVGRPFSEAVITETDNKIPDLRMILSRTNTVIGTAVEFNTLYYLGYGPNRYFFFGADGGTNYDLNVKTCKKFIQGSCCDTGSCTYCKIIDHRFYCYDNIPSTGYDYSFEFDRTGYFKYAYYASDYTETITMEADGTVSRNKVAVE